MTNALRQLCLDTANYRNGKAWGKNNYCKYCWACYHSTKCIANPETRSKQILCVKAKDRMDGKHTASKLEESFIYDGKRERHRTVGLKKNERW